MNVNVAMLVSILLLPSIAALRGVVTQFSRERVGRVSEHGDLLHESESMKMIFVGSARLSNHSYGDLVQYRTGSPIFPGWLVLHGESVLLRTLCSKEMTGGAMLWFLHLGLRGFGPQGVVFFGIPLLILILICRQAILVGDSDWYKGELVRANGSFAIKAGEKLRPIHKNRVLGLSPGDEVWFRCTKQGEGRWLVLENESVLVRSLLSPAFFVAVILIAFFVYGLLVK